MPTLQKFCDENPAAALVTAAVAAVTMVFTAGYCCWRGRKVNKNAPGVDVTTSALLAAAARLKTSEQKAAAPAPTAAAATTYRLTPGKDESECAVEFSTKQSVIDFVKLDAAQFATKKVVHLTVSTNEALPTTDQKARIVAIFSQATIVNMTLPEDATKDWSWGFPSGVAHRTVIDQVAAAAR